MNAPLKKSINMTVKVQIFSRFLWNRTNAQDIKADEKVGPETDHLNSETGYFVLVNSNLEIKDPPMTTELVSPMLIGNQHPKECLAFWFIITVAFFCFY